jgi:hypothetical protein
MISSPRRRLEPAIRNPRRPSPAPKRIGRRELPDIAMLTQLGVFGQQGRNYIGFGLQAERRDLLASLA